MAQPTTAPTIAAELARGYPHATCELVHENAWQLLVATVLSAQCTDQRVNQVTPPLFAAYPDAFALAHARTEDVAAIIRPTGLHTTKANNLIKLSAALVDHHGGDIPRTREELVALPGVGRKTANVVLGTYFHIPALPVDTHVLRVTGRLGLSTSTRPETVEKQLCAQLDPEQWVDFSHRAILHGRRVCHARAAACGACYLSHLCPSANPPQPADRDKVTGEERDHLLTLAGITP